MLSRRSFLGGLAALACASRAGSASASIARALTLRELVDHSRHVIVANPLDFQAKWEKVGQRERIVTYTLLRVEEALDGRAPTSTELTVRTLGGAVDGIAQIVPGEAVMHRGVRATVFAEPFADGVFGVAGMAQGHYPLRPDARGIDRLAAHFGEVVRIDAESALVRLDGRTVPETHAIIAKELLRAK